MQKNLKERIIKNFTEVRAKTHEIFDLAREESILHGSPGFGFRPILWHLAHIGAFEEYWLLQKIGGKSAINEKYQSIFDPIKTPRENSKNLPSRREMNEYLQKARDGVLSGLDKIEFAENNPLLSNGYIFDLVLQHELQHQETLACLFQMLPLAGKNDGQTGRRADAPNKNPQSAIRNPQSLTIPEGFVNIGANGDKYCYDNESPCHEVFVESFKIDKFLTTNAEFAEFIAEKGYDRKEFWSAEGWEFCKKENWQNPLYWTKTGEDSWQIKRMFNEVLLENVPDFPVSGVSFYEATAYAKFRGKRLPTEFELEKAAKLQAKIISPETANCAFNYWETTPVGIFLSDDKTTKIADLQGNLWEWTTSDFRSFPNFEAFPYPEYSQTWFDGDHKVLKGGSWATSAEILRPTFRNFFRRGFRIAFAGIRLVSSI